MMFHGYAANSKALINNLRALISNLESVDKQFGSVDKQFESVDRQFESVGKQISHATNVTYGLMVALIVVAVGIPQIVIAWRGRRDSEQARRIEELSQEIETLKQQRIVSS